MFHAQQVLHCWQESVDVDGTLEHSDVLKTSLPNDSREAERERETTFCMLLITLPFEYDAFWSIKSW